MPHEGDIKPDTMPPGFVCVVCRYDLSGLRWGARCPECGYLAPAGWPTDKLSEAHPAFVRATYRHIRGIVAANAIVLLALVALAGACFAAVLSQSGPDRWETAWWLMMAGFITLAAGLVVGLVFAGLIGRRHRNARKRHDQPKRKSVSLPFWWCVGPPSATLALAIVTGGFGGLLFLITIPIAVASAGVLYYTLCEHAESLIRRCERDARWTWRERTIGWGSLLAFVLSPVSMPFVIEATLPFLILGFAMLVTAHLLRMLKAARRVRAVLDRIEGLTAEDQPPESHRS